MNRKAQTRVRTGVCCMRMSLIHICVQNGKITVDASTIASAGDYQGTVIFTSAYGE